MYAVCTQQSGSMRYCINFLAGGILCLNLSWCTRPRAPQHIHHQTDCFHVDGVSPNYSMEQNDMRTMTSPAGSKTTVHNINMTSLCTQYAAVVKYSRTG